MKWFSEVGLVKAAQVLKFFNKLNEESIPPEHIKYHHSDETGYTIFYYHSEKIVA